MEIETPEFNAEESAVLARDSHVDWKWNGERVRTLRLRSGWSQAELARRLGCRQQTVSEWETNVYQPQNAYSRLLDMMLNNLELSSRRTNARPLSEVVMRDLGLAQVNFDDVHRHAMMDFQRKK